MCSGHIFSNARQPGICRINHPITFTYAFVETIRAILNSYKYAKSSISNCKFWDVMAFKIRHVQLQIAVVCLAPKGAHVLFK